jgi:CheY-like chemotaxis protein
MASRILVADNDLDFLNSLASLLEGEGYSVIVAGTPGEALQILQQVAVDVVITDFRLKDDSACLDTTGVGVYQAAQEQDIPAVLMSASRYGVPAGFRYVHKGSRDVMLEKIQKLLGTA